jgi:hypothetical protein
MGHVCPDCAERARTLRAAQWREGCHLEDEPDLTPDPTTDDQQWWMVLRSEAQQSRDQAADGGQDTADFDALIAELDEEIARSGVRGKVAPDRPARHRSTRRRQDAPDLPRRKVAPRSAGRGAALAAVLAAVRELAPLRHRAQERPPRPGPRRVQGQGPRR